MTTETLAQQMSGDAVAIAAYRKAFRLLEGCMPVEQARESARIAADKARAQYLACKGEV